MTRTLFQAGARDRIRARLAGLAPERAPRWGRNHHLVQFGA